MGERAGQGVPCHRPVRRHVLDAGARDARDRLRVVAKGVTDMHVSSLLLGEATAAPIASAYFGLCWRMGELDEDEQRVWSVLRNEVTEAIQTRNDIAHGDWEVGSLAMGEAEGELKVMPPRLIQIIPTRREGAYQYTDLTVEDIHALSDRIEDLLGLIQDFGKLAQSCPYSPTTRARTSARASTG